MLALRGDCDECTYRTIATQLCQDALEPHILMPPSDVHASDALRYARRELARLQCRKRRKVVHHQFDGSNAGLRYLGSVQLDARIVADLRSAEAEFGDLVEIDLGHGQVAVGCDVPKKRSDRGGSGDGGSGRLYPRRLLGATEQGPNTTRRRWWWRRLRRQCRRRPLEVWIQLRVRPYSEGQVESEALVLDPARPSQSDVSFRIAAGGMLRLTTRIQHPSAPREQGGNWALQPGQCHCPERRRSTSAETG